MILIQLALLIILLSAIFFASERGRGYPPGPMRIPILGNLLYLCKLDKEGLGKILFDLSKTYGKVFSFHFGSYRFIIINDYKLIKEAWNNPLLCGRQKAYVLKARTGGTRRGILFQDGEEWKEQRRFAVRHLKEFGLGKRSMESLIMPEVLELISGFQEDLGSPISLRFRFNAAVVNSLWAIATGSRFSHGDPELLELVENIERCLSLVGISNPVLYVTWMAKIAPEWSGLTKLVGTFTATYDYFDNYAKVLIGSYEQGTSYNNYAHAFVSEMLATTNNDSSFYAERGQKTMAAVLLDLFSGGAETTSSTLNWLFLYLTVFPHEQKMVQQEIDKVLTGRLPTLDDLRSMPYTEAVILETLRHSSIFPLALPHRALGSTQLGCYTIPKGAFLLSNLHSVHFNPENWTKPHDFLPGRFLTEDKTKVMEHLKGFIPFSTGKRACIGEKLAKDEIFLFATSILQQFDVTWDPTMPKPSLDKRLREVISPKEFRVVMKKRNM